jgi:glycosyltransferase involved in cell wall biosynthesis
MPHSTPSDVAVLMPAYQLESTIAANVKRVAGVVADWPGVEVIVIDDGSTDGTRVEADLAAADHDFVTVVGYPINRGKGGALQEGFAHSHAETVIFLDSDLDLPPEQLPQLLDEFDRLGVDVLVGAKRSAMTPGRYPAPRRLLSLSFVAVNRLLFRLPIRETQTGLKIFRRSALEDTLPRLTTLGYAFDLELLVRIRRAGGSMAETPVTLSKGSSSGLALRTLWEMGRDTLKIWFRSLRGWRL